MFIMRSQFVQKLTVVMTLLNSTFFSALSKVSQALEKSINLSLAYSLRVLERNP